MSQPSPAGRFRLRWFHVAPVVLVLVVVSTLLVARRKPARRDHGRAVTATPLPSRPTGTVPVDVGPQREVTFFWPAADAAGLHARTGSVPVAATKAEEARALVQGLLAGPQDAKLFAPLPPSAKLRALYLDGKGTAYVDLSAEVVRDAPGGSTWEILAVQSVVNSLTRSFPEIRRVQFLIEGQEVETLAGHVDLSRPVGFDDSVVVPG